MLKLASSLKHKALIHITVFFSDAVCFNWKKSSQKTNQIKQLVCWKQGGLNNRNLENIVQSLCCTNSVQGGLCLSFQLPVLCIFFFPFEFVPPTIYGRVEPRNCFSRSFSMQLSGLPLTNKGHSWKSIVYLSLNLRN